MRPCVGGFAYVYQTLGLGMAQTPAEFSAPGMLAVVAVLGVLVFLVIRNASNRRERAIDELGVTDRPATTSSSLSASEQREAAAHLEREARPIGQSFVTFQKELSRDYGEDLACVFDAALLPFPKHRIERALLDCLAMADTTDERNRLATALLMLARFQPSVGQSPLSPRGAIAPVSEGARKELDGPFSLGALKARLETRIDPRAPENAARWRVFDQAARAETTRLVRLLEAYPDVAVIRWQTKGRR